MHARRVGLALGMMLCGSAALAQETQVAVRIVPEATRFRSAKMQARNFSASSARKDAGPRRDFPPQAPREFKMEPARPVPPPTPRFRAEAPPVLAPLRVTAERSSFLTEARIPIAQMWSGRLRFSGVQQRFHAANLYSAVNPAFFSEVAGAPGAESIVGRARVNYGVGLQLRFGR